MVAVSYTHLDVYKRQGNDTAGMVAGMVASGVTAKGLNGIEAEANKLAKPKRGDVGDGGDAVLNEAEMCIRDSSSTINTATQEATATVVSPLPFNANITAAISPAAAPTHQVVA